jgi:hypothetical protein
MPDLSPAN